MPNMPDNSGDSGNGIILGAILVGRARKLPVNYFPGTGVVRVSLSLLGKAKNLKEALEIARTIKNFSPADKLKAKGISGTG